MSGSLNSLEAAKQPTKQAEYDTINVNARQQGLYDHSFRAPHPSSGFQKLDQLKITESTTSEPSNSLRNSLVQRQEQWSHSTPLDLETIDKIIKSDEKFRTEFKQFLEQYTNKSNVSPIPDYINSESRENGYYDHSFRAATPHQNSHSSNAVENNAINEGREIFTNRQETWSYSPEIDTLRNVIKSDEKFRAQFEKFIERYTMEKPQIPAADFSSSKKLNLSTSGDTQSQQGENSLPQGGDSE